MWTVNIWFGASPYAEVSEQFSCEAEARAFAASYSEDEYPDVTVRVFAPQEIKDAVENIA